MNRIGGVAYDAASDRLFLARITSFTTAGFVSIHNVNNGMEMDRFDAGIAPTTLVLAFKQVGTSVANRRQAAESAGNVRLYIFKTIPTRLTQPQPLLLN